ncbi:Protein preY, mitochondrial [Lamellibrachia satsuma]|nr:Protein preY, mitochondrial [Lamellibrachia satsuma]
MAQVNRIVSVVRSLSLWKSKPNMRCQCRNVIACRNYTSAADANNSQQVFDEKMLEYLVCPLSKTPLRYDKETSTLICDELQVAYPIVNGIPNLVPEDATKLHIEDDVEKKTPHYD